MMVLNKYKKFMKREIKELKRIARGNLQGNYITLMNAFMTCNILVSLAEMPFMLVRDEVFLSASNIIYYVAVVLIHIASVILTAGQYHMHLQTARTGKTSTTELFTPARNHSDRFIFTELILFVIYALCLFPVIGAGVCITLYESMQSYLFALVLSIIGGILTLYVTLNFGLVYFVMNDNHNLSMLEALKYTKNLVHHHKKRYLYLQCSFLGMLLLVALSFGIGIFWVHPYMTQTTALFYLDVKGELDTVLDEKRKKNPAPKPTVINHYV